MTTPNVSSGWWARFTFNGITRYDQGAYGLVGGVAEGFCAAVELSDAERDEEVSPTGAATAGRSAARSRSGCSPAPKAAANAAGQAVAWQTPHERALCFRGVQAS